MKKVLLIILIVFLATTTGLATLVMSLFYGWSPLVALIPPALFIGLPILYYILKALFAWLARRRYAKSVLRTEKRVTPDEREEFNNLSQQWRHGVTALRPASMKGQFDFDPIKELPWILLMGPPGSAKRLAMAESGLFNNYRTQSGNLDYEGGSPGCDWYFFESGIFVDIKGIIAKNSVQAELSQASKQWDTFLGLLESVKRKNPLEGVILTLPSRLLNPENHAELKELAIRARERLDSLAKRTDQTIPVYILLTRLDLRPGLARALELMERNNARVGYLFEPATAPDSDTATTVISYLENELRSIFIAQLGREDNKRMSPLLAAPDELNCLEKPLSLFLATLGHYSSYAPNHDLKGVFFSIKSPAKPDNGGLSSSAVPESERIAPEGKDQSSGLALAQTLAEFFGKIVPEFKFLTKRLNLPGSRRQKATLWGLGLVYLATLLFGLALLMEVKFNREINDTAQDAAMASALARGKAAADYLTTADSLNFVLSHLNSARKNNRLAGLWPSRGDKFRGKLREEFLDSFEKANLQVLGSIEHQLYQPQGPSNKEFSVSLNQLVWLFAVYDSYRRHEDYALLSSYFPPLPPGFNGPSKPYWTMGYAKILFEYLDEGPNVIRVNDTIETLEKNMARGIEMAS
ncbi:MAG: hypothetical protein LBU69_01725, partial [Deltaproteobacteria bacterium]|nr:hypothetical protein [Deltaproteobacteria bacterium]